MLLLASRDEGLRWGSIRRRSGGEGDRAEQDKVANAILNSESKWIRSAPVVRCAAAKRECSEEVTAKLFQEAFQTYPHAKAIVLPWNQFCQIDSGKLRSNPVESGLGFWEAHKGDFLEPLTVRRAREEDNDNIDAVLQVGNEAGEVLASLPEWTRPDEDYALSRLLGQSQHAFLMESEENGVVGFLSLSSLVDVDSLSSEHDLAPFDHLREVHDDGTYGRPTCLRIELFCMDPKYAVRANELVEKVLARETAYEFLVVSMPHASPESPILREFTRAKPRLMQPSGVAYILHRIALQPISPREAHSKDEAAMFLSSRALERGEKLVVAECSGQPVGCAAFASAAASEKWEALPQDAAAAFADAPIELVEATVMNVLQTKEGLFMAKALGLLEAECCMYRDVAEGSNVDDDEDDDKGEVPHIVNSIFAQVFRWGRNAAKADAAHIFMRSFACRPKLRVNARLVVIGASAAGLRTIASLVQDRRLRLPELVLIAPKEGQAARRIREAGMKRQVTVLHESVEEINRNSGVVRLSNGNEVSFEQIVFSPGLEDAPEVVLGEHLDPTVVKRSELQQAISDPGHAGSVIVYGSGLAALETVHALLRLGVAAEAIQVWCPIGGPDRLWQMAQYSSARNSLPLFPTSMNAQKEGNLLSVEHGIATFLTETGEFEQAKAQVVIPTENKAVPEPAFSAANDAELVVDGRIVVDKLLRTNDPRILAIGKVAKFSRACGEAPWLEYCSAEAAGQCAADVLRAPWLGISQASTIATLRQRATAMTSWLPNGTHFAYVCKPAELSIGGKEADSGFGILASSSAEGRSCVIRERNGWVSSVAICAEHEVQGVRELGAIIGMPASCLDNLPQVRQTSELVGALTAPELGVLRHPNLPELLERVAALIVDAQGGDVDQGSLREVAFAEAAKWADSHYLQQAC